MEDAKTWEEVSKWLYRIKVDGGHLYQSNEGNAEVAMCFVPDVDLKRYESHLRDAYNRGYKAGFDDSKNGFELPKEVARETA